MSYLEKSLTTNEEIKEVIIYHWFVWLTPVIYFFLGFVFLPYSLFFTFVSIMSFLNLKFTDQGVTTKKSIKKTGIVSVKTEELFISKTETVEMNQSFWGRIFGFGDVKLTGTGNSYLIFNTISSPLEVKKRIEELIDSK
jgi:uncharacterized membrane protein YdbT with pleckstrin-like domain|tara:strand:+ start:1572 stop:1988 length:417 start_codon:yes stop_codon:yes gene_type:complete